MALKWRLVTKDRKSIIVKGRYQKSYLPGMIIEAEKGTYGLMVFETKKQAQKAMEEYPLKNIMIIKVDCKGWGYKPKMVCYVNNHYSGLSEAYLDHWYNYDYEGPNGFDFFCSTASEPPEGTICYNRLEILE